MKIYLKKTLIGILSAALLLGLFPATLTFADVKTVGEDTTPSGIKLSELEKSVDNYVKDYIGDCTPGAAVVVVKNNEIVLSKGYGKVKQDGNKAVDNKNTMFHYRTL